MLNRQEDLIRRYEGYKFYIKKPILDIGGGDGLFLESQEINDATIIDLNLKQNSKYNYIKKNLTSSLDLDKKYKTIFIMEVLEHMAKPKELLKKAYNLLEDDGILYISIPYTKLNTNKHGNREWDLGHVSRWTLQEITSDVKEIGFRFKVIQKRRRLKGFGFWLPHCWLVLELKKEINTC